TLAALTLALTWPAAAAGIRDCKIVYADMKTTVVEPNVEFGPVEGLINGAALLRYDDMAPPISIRWDRPNLIITTRSGNINLWVYSDLKPDGGDNWWRRFTVLRAEGTGGYEGRRITLDIYGKCSAKQASYEIEGMICPPSPPK